MKHQSIVALTVIAAIALAAAYLVQRASEAPNDQQVAFGRQLYAQNCASCHGADLEGEPNWQTRDEDGYLPAPPHDESGHTWHHSPEQLFTITKHGIAEVAGLDDYRTRMPAFENVLSDDEIRATLAFIESQWPEEIRAMRARNRSAGRD